MLELLGILALGSVIIATISFYKNSGNNVVKNEVEKAIHSLNKKSPKEQLLDLKHELYNKMIELKSKRKELEFKLDSSVDKLNEYKKELSKIPKDELKDKINTDRKIKYKIARMNHIIKIKHNYDNIVEKMKINEEEIYNKYMEIAEKVSLVDSHEIILDVNNILNNLNMSKYNVNIDINLEEEIRKSEIKSEAIKEVNDMIDIEEKDNKSNKDDLENVIDFIYK